MIFQSRYEAWSYLWILLKNKIFDFSDTVILWILRGGSIIAQQLSLELGICVNFVIIKSLYYDGKKIWAVVQNWLTIYNKKLIWKLWLSEEEVEDIRKKAFEEAKDERERFWLKNYDFTWKQVVIVDDWVKTWFTAVAAAKFAKQSWARRIIFAFPVIRDKALAWIKNFFDEIIFPEVSDDSNFNLHKYYMSYYSLNSEEVMEVIQKLKQSNCFIG